MACFNQATLLSILIEELHIFKVQGSMIVFHFPIYQMSPKGNDNISPSQ